MNSDSKERLASRLPQDFHRPKTLWVDHLDDAIAEEPDGAPTGDGRGIGYLQAMRSLREQSFILRAESVRLRLESRHFLQELRSLRQQGARLAEAGPTACADEAAGVSSEAFCAEDQACTAISNP